MRKTKISTDFREGTSKLGTMYMNTLPNKYQFKIYFLIPGQN